MKQASVKIERLDEFLGRARKLARLADAGKPIPEKTHPGHGRLKEVRARAKAIKLEALVA